MSSEYDGSIDDVLNSQPMNSQIPQSPEQDYDDESVDYGSDGQDEIHESSNQSQNDNSENEEEGTEDESTSSSTDEYGNAKPAAKTYTEEEVNERINRAVRERLARGGTQQPTEQAMQKQVAGFEYDPDANESWQQQLELFVEQTVSKMSQKQQAQVQREREQNAQAEFETKFTQGMDKFGDFRDVVGQQPITDSMTIALRGMKDPASFIYAAAKRSPQELARIAKIPDHVAQIVEMGKLEERMRKTASGTNAPRPVSRTSEDAGLPAAKKKSEPSIEDLIAKNDAKKFAQIKQRRAR
jgi:hypothetical protein